MNDSALSFKSTGALLKETASEWLEDNALRLSAALAYYSTFSIAPLIVIALAIAGWVFGRDAANGLLDQQLQKFLLGGAAAEGVEGMLQSASKPSSSAMAAVLGFLALLLGASGVFGQLKDALNTIWEVRQKKGSAVKRFFRERLLSFGMVSVIGFLLLVSLLLSAAVSGLAGYFGSGLPAPLLTALSSIVSFGVIIVLFAAIFKLLPDVKIQWRDVWMGALVTALLFEIGKFLLALYLGRQSTSSAYGAATAVVLVLLWVYHASLILFFGAEFTQVYAKARGARIEPARMRNLCPRRHAPSRDWGERSEAAIPAPPKESLHQALGIREPVNSASGFFERNAIYLLLGGLLGGVLAGSGLRALERELSFARRRDQTPERVSWLLEPRLGRRRFRKGSEIPSRTTSSQGGGQGVPPSSTARSETALVLSGNSLTNHDSVVVHRKMASASYNARMKTTRSLFSCFVSFTSSTRLKNSTVSSSVSSRPLCKYGGESLTPRKGNVLIGPSALAFRPLITRSV